MTELSNHKENEEVCFETDEQAASERLHNIFRIVTARLSTVENYPLPVFHLRFLLACGSGSLTGINARYEINLRQCIVDISSDNCEIDLANAYGFELPAEIFVENYSVEESKSGSTASDGNLTVDVSFGLKDRASIAMRGKLTKDTATKIQAGRKAAGKRNITLISCNGSHWTVGDDEYGDPRRPGGVLKERYFHEDPNRPLCAVKLKPGAKTARVGVEVRAKFGQLDVDVLDGMGRPAHKINSSHVDDVSEAIKRRLKGIVLAKALHERQYGAVPHLPPEEFLLARSVVIVRPTKSSPIDERQFPSRRELTTISRKQRNDK